MGWGVRIVWGVDWVCGVEGWGMVGCVGGVVGGGEWVMWGGICGCRVG